MSLLGNVGNFGKAEVEPLTNGKFLVLFAILFRVLFSLHRNSHRRDVWTNKSHLIIFLTDKSPKNSLDNNVH